jgi:hypothetical protein
MSFAEALFSGNKKTGTAGFFVTILFSYKLVAPVEICCASLVATGSYGHGEAAFGSFCL